MKFLVVALVLIMFWVIAVFVVDIATGWVHLPLAVGSVLIAIGIVVSGEQRAGGGKRETGSREPGAANSK